MRHKEDLSSERLAMVESWRQSGLSVRAYCEIHHLSPYTLQYWKGKSAKRNAPQKSGLGPSVFVPVKITRAALPTNPSPVFCELVTPSGRRLLFRRQVAAHFLKSLLD
jgi:hypothetical protein